VLVAPVEIVQVLDQVVVDRVVERVPDAHGRDSAEAPRLDRALHRVIIDRIVEPGMSDPRQAQPTTDVAGR